MPYRYRPELMWLYTMQSHIKEKSKVSSYQLHDLEEEILLFAKIYHSIEFLHTENAKLIELMSDDIDQLFILAKKNNHKSLKKFAKRIRKDKYFHIPGNHRELCLELIMDYEFIFNISDDDPLSYARAIEKGPESCLYVAAFTVIIFFALLIWLFVFS